MAKKQTMQRFDRQQLELVVNVMLMACVDSFESTLPQSVDEVVNLHRRVPLNPWKLYPPYLNELGWSLSILYAQLTDDGMGVGDALSIVGIDKPLVKMAKARTSLRWKGFKPGEKISDIDTLSMARKFVARCFDYEKGDYLRP